MKTTSTTPLAVKSTTGTTTAKIPKTTPKVTPPWLPWTPEDAQRRADEQQSRLHHQQIQDAQRRYGMPSQPQQKKPPKQG